EPGTYRNLQARVGLFSRADQPDGAVQAVRRVDIDSAHMADTVSGNSRDIQATFKNHARENTEFIASVLTVDVKRRIGFGEPRSLCLRQSFREFNAAALHLSEDVVGGAVQDAVHRAQTVACGGLVNHPQNGNAPRDAGLEANRKLARGSQAKQFVSMFGEQILVGRHHGLALLQGRANKLPRLSRATHGFDNNIDIRILQYLPPVGDNTCSFGSVLGLHSGTPTYGGYEQAHTAAMRNQIRMLGDDVGGCAPHRAKANNPDSKLLRVHGREVSIATGSLSPSSGIPGVPLAPRHRPASW